MTLPLIVWPVHTLLASLLTHPTPHPPPFQKEPLLSLLLYPFVGLTASFYPSVHSLSFMWVSSRVSRSFWTAGLCLFDLVHRVLQQTGA